VCGNTVTADFLSRCRGSNQEYYNDVISDVTVLRKQVLENKTELHSPVVLGPINLFIVARYHTDILLHTNNEQMPTKSYVADTSAPWRLKYVASHHDLSVAMV